jgi:hypothetical protein
VQCAVNNCDQFFDIHAALLTDKRSDNFTPSCMLKFCPSMEGPYEEDHFRP